MTCRLEIRVKIRELQTHQGSRFWRIGGYDSYSNPIAIVLIAGGDRHA